MKDNLKMKRNAAKTTKPEEPAEETKQLPTKIVDESMSTASQTNTT